MSFLVLFNSDHVTIDMEARSATAIEGENIVVLGKSRQTAFIWANSSAALLILMDEIGLSAVFGWTDGMHSVQIFTPRQLTPMGFFASVHTHNGVRKVSSIYRAISVSQFGMSIDSSCSARATSLA